MVIWHISIKIDVQLFRLFQNGANRRICFFLYFSSCPIASLSTSVTWLSSYLTQQAPRILDPPSLRSPSSRVLLSTKPVFCVSGYSVFVLGLQYYLSDCLLFLQRAPQCPGPLFPSSLLPPIPSTGWIRKVICLRFSVQLIMFKKSASALKVSALASW